MPAADPTLVRASATGSNHTSAIGQAAAAIAAAVIIASPAAPAFATGLESLDLTEKLQSLNTGVSREFAESEAKKLAAVDDSFEKSDTLKRLLEQSAANKDKNKRAILDKYCYRQAEIGVGDCGGLRFIPGMTESGKQRTPDWLSSLLGVEPAPPAQEGMTLKTLLPGAGGAQ
eukprot:CAMPEP_0202868660 /NCGR_PEP_ID=MMETSP1391-20130828/11003_1 /ASSEMBLY_ACC=CAM_ASM_000867 /TAXON_ID=1034604 /ORGANISM="Chlamydomonas leiostraca, Strain SAG 11-49" /LENGTH=172 /DNA_ID=CAMNT_0049548855 /DNA_START=143 /DNA_END=662 /DNA_ORIENTATION=-